ncbi:MAG: helix-turn-helix transcriptional regulator [Pseudomonadota bacterium]|nr:helix-turn-helix transcriptional regulator [Pseudomonadota bacterium]
MTQHLTLLKLYQCQHLDTLIETTSQAFELIGFPYVLLKWCPTPASDSTMIANSTPVWSNFSARLGTDGDRLLGALTDSIRVGLRDFHRDTIERQTWKSHQSSAFWVIGDAPREFSLSHYQRTLICDFGQGAWREFAALPLCRERDRVLVLEAKTQDPICQDVGRFVGKLFSVFLSVFRSLHVYHAPSIQADGSCANNQALSQKELNCLQWLAAGKTLTEAATILGITERTLRYHISNARERLGVATTMQAVVAASLMYGFNPKDARKSVYSMCRTYPFKTVASG